MGLSVDKVVRRHPKARQIGLLPGDPPRLLITATGREHPGILRRVALRARGSLVPHGLAPAPGQRDHVIDVFHRSISTIQSAVPAPLRINTEEPPEVQQVLRGVRLGERTGFTRPVAVLFGPNLLGISFRPSAHALAKLLTVLVVLRALAGLALGRQTVISGAIAGPLRRRSGDPALGTPLLRRGWDLIGLSGCVLLRVLASVRPLTLLAVVLQPVLHTLVFAKRSPRLLLFAARAALRRQDYNLIRVSGRVLLHVLAVVRPLAVPAAVIQFVLLTLVLAELGHRQLLLTPRAALRRHRLHSSPFSVFLLQTTRAASEGGSGVLILGYSFRP